MEENDLEEAAVSLWKRGRVSACSICIKADNASPMTFGGTNTWILLKPENGECVIVDPAEGEAHAKTVLAVCRAAHLEPTAVLLTHNHLDHSRCAVEMAARAGIKVHARAAGMKGPTPFSADLREALPLPDGPFSASVTGPQLEIVSLPGHSSDSVGIIYPCDRSIATGDLIFAEGSTVVLHPDGDLRAYMESLDELERLIRHFDIERVLCAHGDPLVPPFSRIDEQRKHRLDRLDEVRAAIVSGAGRDAEAIARIVYPDVGQGLTDAVMSNVRAQLAYLEAVDDVCLEGY